MACTSLLAPPAFASSIAAAWSCGFSRRSVNLPPAERRPSFSTDPAILRSGVPKSGRSTIASSRPITQNRWLCVNSASKPSTATISNCSLCDLCAIRSGKRVQVQIEIADPRTEPIRKMPTTTITTSVSPGSGDEAWQMMRGGWMKRRDRENFGDLRCRKRRRRGAEGRGCRERRSRGADARHSQ
jgi:hypothetical protein